MFSVLEQARTSRRKLGFGGEGMLLPEILKLIEIRKHLEDCERRDAANGLTLAEVRSLLDAAWRLYELAPLLHAIVDFQELDPEIQARRRAARAKVAYACPGCSMRVWGKPGLHVVCGDCEEELEEAEPSSEPESAAPSSSS